MGQPASKDRNTPLSDFVRKLIEEHVAKFRAENKHDRGSLVEIARRGGWSTTSSVAMVKRGTGVGGKNAPRFARAFGYPDVGALERAAAEDFMRSGAAARDMLDSPPTEAIRTAIDAALLLKQGTEEQIVEILHRYSHSDFLDRDADWWQATILAELKLARALLHHDAKLRVEIRDGQRKVRATNDEREAARAKSVSDSAHAAKQRKKKQRAS